VDVVEAADGIQPGTLMLSGSADGMVRWLWNRAEQGEVAVDGNDTQRERLASLLTIATQ